MYVYFSPFSSGRERTRWIPLKAEEKAPWGVQDRVIMEQLKYNYQRLKNYAEWYYFCYYPSNEKFFKKLCEKWELSDAEKIYAEMEEFLVEDRTLETIIENYIHRNKNYRYIASKMREKLFSVEKVEKYLEKYRESWESLLREEYLIRKIENFLQKGKSKNYIFQKLWETPEDKELLEHIFQKYFYEWEDDALRREYEKIKDWVERKYSSLWPREQEQKIIQKLIAKGFSYDAIKKMLKNLQ